MSKNAINRYKLPVPYQAHQKIVELVFDRVALTWFVSQICLLVNPNSIEASLETFSSTPVNWIYIWT